MTLDDPTFAEVERALRPFLRGASDVTPESRIMADLGLDSLAVMDFVMDLEERFDLVIPIDRIAEVRTVGDLVAAIGRIQGEGAAGRAAPDLSNA